MLGPDNEETSKTRVRSPIKAIQTTAASKTPIKAYRKRSPIQGISVRKLGSPSKDGKKKMVRQKS